MSVVNVSNFLVELNKKISNTSNDKELLMLTKALEKLKTGVVFTVGTFANLPDPTENVGKLYFVEADALLYFSFIVADTTIAQWISITRVSVNTLWTWGGNNGNQLATGVSQQRRCSPGTTSGLGNDWINVSVMQKEFFGSSVAGIKCDGTLWTWGSGTCGQSGNGDVLGRCSPGTIAGGGTWKSVDGGDCFGIGLKCDGTLWTWGSGLAGRLGDGTTVCRCSPGTVAGGGTTWCNIASNSGIKCDGTLWTWFSGSGGSLGDGTTVSRSSPGTTWGSYTTWCKLEKSTSSANAAIKIDGTLWTWGINSQGNLGDGTATSRCSPGTVAGGGTNWCCAVSGQDFRGALKTDGTLWTWGGNTLGQLGDGTTVSRCSPGTVAGGGTNWCNVSAGRCSMAAIKTDGTLWTWGSNCYGMLGTNTLVDRCSPGTMVFGGDINSWWNISLGGSFIIALTKETL